MHEGEYGNDLEGHYDSEKDGEFGLVFPARGHDDGKSRVK